MHHDAIYEFRDYTLHPGQRDTLIDLFEREFIEPQEALGAHVRATFRDLDHPDHFVWIRSFMNSESRRTALNAFYSGPVWQAHRNAANATMIDSDNVLQLRPVSGDLGCASAPPRGATPLPAGMILASIYFLAPGSDAWFAAFFANEFMTALRDTRAAPFAAFATEHAPNSFPALPVRVGETVFLTLTHFANAEAHRASAATLRDAEALLAPHVIAATEYRRLQPTARSPLR